MYATSFHVINVYSHSYFIYIVCSACILFIYYALFSYSATLAARVFN